MYIYVCVCVCVYVYIYTHTQTHKMEYSSATKRHTILPFAATWMDLEAIMPNEISQRKTNTI